MAKRVGMIFVFIEIFSQIASKLLWFALHISDKNNFPKPLSAKEESELFEKLAAGDKSAKDKLILHNMRLVAHIVKKYYVSGEEQDELISIGTVGLIKAVGTFKAEKGNRFAAYGSRCIENAIISQRLKSEHMARIKHQLTKNGAYFVAWIAALS